MGKNWLSQNNSIFPHRGEKIGTVTETHQYLYAGGKLLRETISDGSNIKTLDFTYDNAGMPYSLIYNNGTAAETYYYITNLQGDVMYLVDSDGDIKITVGVLLNPGGCFSMGVDESMASREGHAPLFSYA